MGTCELCGLDFPAAELTFCFGCHEQLCDECLGGGGNECSPSCLENIEGLL